MKVRVALLALPLLALSACMSGYNAGPRNSWSDGPLQARLYGGAGQQLRVDVNQPAYVAIFEIAPGQGVGLIYPEGGYEENRLVTRTSWVDIYSRSSRFRWLASYGNPFYNAYAGPTRFYLLVASRMPLNTGRFRRSPLSLQRALGIRASAYNESVVMDALLETVLPPQADEDWTTDVLAVWSEPPLPSGRELVEVRCADGTVVVVPRDMFVYACPRQQQQPPPAATPDSTHAPGGIAHPGGRRPHPTEPVPGQVAEGIATPQSEGARPERPDRGRRVGESEARPVHAAPTQGSARREPQRSEPRIERTEPRSEPRSEPQSVPSAQPRSESTPRVESRERPAVDRSSTPPR